MTKLDSIIKNWNLQNTKILRTSKVKILSGTYEDTPVIVKVFQDPQEFTNQKTVLKSLHASCMPSLIQYDLGNMALMLEEVFPATTLKDLAKSDDEQATIIFSKLLKKLPRRSSSENHLPTIKKWLSAIEGNSHLSPQTLSAAKQAMDFVERFPLDSCILHGDLHHENIIYCSDRGWLAVDPKGLVGPSSFETAIFLLNPIEDLPNLEKFFSRISILHEVLNLDPVLLKNFAFLRAVVGFIWDLEEKKAKDVNHWNIWIEILQSFVSRPT